MRNQRSLQTRVPRPMPIGVAVLVWPVQGARAHCIMGVGTFQTKQVFWTDDSSPHHAFFSFSQVGCESLGIEHGVYPAKHCGIHSKLAASQLACGHIVWRRENPTKPQLLYVPDVRVAAVPPGVPISLLNLSRLQHRYSGSAVDGHTRPSLPWTNCRCRNQGEAVRPVQPV